MQTRAIVINAYGDADVLEEQVIDLPTLGEQQVIVKVSATAVNPIDWKVRAGYAQSMLPWSFPIVLGWDVAGVIEQVGEAVKDWQVGDRVFARPATTPLGTYADYAIVDADLLARIPNNVSDSQAAAVPLAGLTAYQGLVTFGKLQAGQRVLIHAGSGGVGTYAIQLAKALGAFVYTTASEKNHAMLKELGADVTIDYRSERFETIVSELDLVFDTMGGETQQRSYGVLKEGGNLVSIVSLEENDRVSRKEVNAHYFFLEPKGDQLAVLADYMANGQLKSIIGARYPLTEEGIRQAHRLSETHHAVGKIVIENRSV